jgi:hypothetical protein
MLEVIGRGIIARPTSSPDKENGWRQWLGSDTGGLCTLITHSIGVDQMNEDKDKLIRAIFSDYDGTLCSASAARDTSLGQNRIPLEIKKVLQEIAEQIPVCIISSKDYFFLKETRAFVLH